MIVRVPSSPLVPVKTRRNNWLPKPSPAHKRQFAYENLKGRLELMDLSLIKLE